eukprot:Phypoly_transcript_10532.p1 GENE.Phypoly_transcript_10532~~Phypoly_transcript_10532.p1  ORF type:complete len:389 (+),score=48.63 Phypoly_transcript_10532:27-1169(+)
MRGLCVSLILLFVTLLVGYTNASPALVIYAESDLFQYPPYNYTQAFEQFIGLPAGSVSLVPVPDSQLAGIVAGNISGQLDIVIGIDNIRQYSLPQNTFISYASPQLQYIDPQLYAQVSGFNLFPYEYGRVTIIGNSTRIGTKFDPTNLTLHNIAAHIDILKSLIVQNPTEGETGAAFLLASVATFGDSKAGVVGEVTGTNWQDWWTTVLSYAKVEDSWSDSWDLFQKDSTYNLLVSYELDPSYYACTEGENDIIALNLANDQWYLVETIGIHNKTGNLTLAQQFVDWFLSPAVQNLIPEHEWMFPARNNATIPACFKTNVSPNPEFNEILNATTITANFKNWISQWNAISSMPRTTTATSGAPVFFLSGVLGFVWFLIAF